jgi:hypothetical protein
MMGTPSPHLRLVWPNYTTSELSSQLAQLFHFYFSALSLLKQSSVGTGNQRPKGGEDKVLPFRTYRLVGLRLSDFKTF